VRRLLAVALLTPLLTPLLVPATARAQAPDAAGWWNAAHHSAVPATPPPPPDVAAGDLLLQGGDPGRLADGGSAPMPSAYAALRFSVPGSATIGALTLQLGSGAQAADVRAYSTTSSWRPVENGAIEDAPPPDLSRYVGATLSGDGTTLTFPDIGKLATDSGLLSVVLVPGATDRVVVLHPTATALTVSEPPGTEAVPQAPPVAPVLPAVAPAVAPGLAVPPVAPLDPAAPQLAPTSAVLSPQLPARPVAAAAVGRRLVGDDRRTRLVVGLEALLVAIFFGLLGHGPLSALARLTGQPAAVEGERGVGRFRAVRAGTAPRL
jgi:hypothetical protein